MGQPEWDGRTLILSAPPPALSKTHQSRENHGENRDWASGPQLIANGGLLKLSGGGR